MYRLVLYYLRFLVAAAAVLSFFHVLHYNALEIVASAVGLVAVCWGANWVFGRWFNAPTNHESATITALILTLIITPDLTPVNVLFMIAAGGLAMASKYVLAVGRKHVFNPAAIAVVLTAIGPQQAASWWVGTAAMLPFVLVGGLAVVRKIRRGRMVCTFFAAAALATVVYALFGGSDVLGSLRSLALTSSLFFLGFVMLTEPLTTPPTAHTRAWYAILVGVLLPPQVHLFGWYSTPELALVAGNIFAYVVSPKVKLFLTVRSKEPITPDSADFVFMPERPLHYKPGQYMEWTLPDEHSDNRGNRRYFTLASSPTEPELRIGVKFYERSSSYKAALLSIDSQTPVVAAQLAGDFTLPDDPAQKLVFIAGGIGVTPFRSMAKYLIDKQEHRTVTLLYSVHTPDDIAYREVFEEARRTAGLDTTYVLTGSNGASQSALPHSHHGRITAQLIQQTVPDYLERTFYLSGTHGMVTAMQQTLHELGVARSQIKTDFFSGYA